MWLTGNKSVRRHVRRPETAKRWSGRRSAGPVSAGNEVDDAAAAAAGGDADADVVRRYSSSAGARRRSSTARPGRPTSDSRSRCSTGRGRRRTRRSTRCRATLNKRGDRTTFTHE